MTVCCAPSQSDQDSPRRYRCPVNGKEYGRVGLRTVLQHVREPWEKDLSARAYYFCSDTDCEVVYFGHDDTVIPSGEVRTPVGAKSRSPDRTVCYCFDIPYAKAAESEALREFVKQQTKQSLCACETSNPSGKCCLKDFPRS